MVFSKIKLSEVIKETTFLISFFEKLKHSQSSFFGYLSWINYFMYSNVFVVTLLGEIILFKNVFEVLYVKTFDKYPFYIEGAEPFIVIFPESKMFFEILIWSHFGNSIEAITVDDSEEQNDWFVRWLICFWKFLQVLRSCGPFSVFHCFM